MSEAQERFAIEANRAQKPVQLHQLAAKPAEPVVVP